MLSSTGIASTPRKPVDHGTNRGYYAHHRRRESPCDRCKRAHAERKKDLLNPTLEPKWTVQERVPYEVLIPGDVIEILLPNAKRMARAVVENIYVTDKTADLRLSLEGHPNLRTSIHLKDSKFGQGIRLVPVNERLQT